MGEGSFGPTVDGTPGGSPNSGGRTDFRFRRLEMPLFDGTNPDGWILKAERYFAFHRFTNDEKLEAAVVAFEGDALVMSEILTYEFSQ